MELGPGIDFDKLCPFWEFFEGEGLNERIVNLAPHIVDPVLLLGSGQGLVSEALGTICKDLTNLDKSPTMAVYAKLRRGQDTILDEVDSFKLGRLFATIVVNTGIITAPKISTGFVERLVGTILRHMSPSGKVIVSYFRRSVFSDDGEKLGLVGKMSNSDIFLEANGDLDRAKALLLTRGVDASVADQAFRRNESKLIRHSQLIVAVGQRYIEVHGESPVAFIRRYMGFYPYNLWPEDEVRMRCVLERELRVLEEHMINEDTNVLILERRHS